MVMNENTMKAMFAIRSHNKCYENLRYLWLCFASNVQSRSGENSLYCAVLIDVISTIRLKALVCF